MPINALGHESPIRRSVRHRELDYAKLEAAGTLTDEGRPLDALKKVLEHFFPDRTITDLVNEAFVFDQGSSRVSVKVEGDDVAIQVPLVRLADGGKAIAAMRYMLTNIAASGQLYQPRLRGDDVCLEFREPLARLHPAKIVEVLRKMPLEADDNDDFMVSEFGAHPLDRVPLTPLTEDELERAKRIWQLHWDEVDELVKECRRKRSMFFLNELTAYALNRILCALPLSGIVGNKLDRAASVFNDGHEEPMKREAALAKCVKEMKAVSPDELVKSLAHATYAISPHDEGSPGVLHKQFCRGDYLEHIGRLRTKDGVMDATLAVASTYTFLLVEYAWPEEIERALLEGLAKIAGKPWREAANVAYEHAKGLVAKYADDEDEDEEDDEDEGDEDEGDEDEGDEDEDDDSQDGDE